MANKKSDPDSTKTGDQIASDEFIEDLDEEELKKIKGGIRYQSVNNDTLFAGPGISKTGSTFDTIYGGSGNDTIASNTATLSDRIGSFDKLKR